jgi:hypothetical protein
MTHNIVNTTGANSETETAYLPGTPEFTPVLVGFVLVDFWYVYIL